MPETLHAPARILVVEDDESMRLAYEQLFARSGYEVLSAGGVYEALRAVQRATPDLILADLMLPDGDGMGLTRALRAISSTVGVPVIAVTASARSLELLEPRSFGAECLLLKPVPEEALLACVAEALAKRGKGVAPAGATTAVGLAEAPATTTASSVAPDGIPFTQPRQAVAVHAPDGTRWTVHYTRARDASGRDALLFVSRGGYRRVTDFPPDWDRLSGEELWMLGGA